ncbi:MAG: glycosyltransferase [Elusimicrobia bacterium]|nr:glycosyltransferase [Elusimicrobiota bacterium]
MGVKLLINSLFRGGAEKQFAALAPHIPHDALYLLERDMTLETGGESPFSLSDHDAATSSVLKTASIPLYARRLAALSRPRDTVLSFMERANFVNVLASERSGHRAVICERTQPSREFSGIRALAFKPLIKKLYPRASVIVANSNGVKNDLVSNFSVPADKIRIINNGYDITAIAEKAEEPLPAPYAGIFKRPVLATSGRLTAAKGQWHMLRLFRKIKTARKDAALMLFGEGELRGYLMRLSEELGFKTFRGRRSGNREQETGAGALENFDVYFPGFEENPYKFLAHARLFLFTSLWEGFPNALVEAMASGVPVISSDCASGPREILAPDTPFEFQTRTPEPAPHGVLMPPLSGFRRRASTPLEPAEELWAETALALLNDKTARENYARSGLERAKDFELSKTAGQWRELLIPENLIKFS